MALSLASLRADADRLAAEGKPGLQRELDREDAVLDSVSRSPGQAALVDDSAEALFPKVVYWGHNWQWSGESVWADFTGASIHQVAVVHTSVGDSYDYYQPFTNDAWVLRGDFKYAAFQAQRATPYGICVTVSSVNTHTATALWGFLSDTQIETTEDVDFDCDDPPPPTEGGGGGGDGSGGFWITVTTCWGYHYFEDGLYQYSVVEGCTTEAYWVDLTLNQT